MMPEFMLSVKERPKTAPSASLEKPKLAEEKSTRKKMSNLRKVIATRLVEAKNTNSDAHDVQ